MNGELRELLVEQRMRLVEDLCDSIAADQKALPLTDWQRAELDRRLTPMKPMAIWGCLLMMCLPTSGGGCELSCSVASPSLVREFLMSWKKYFRVEALATGTYA